MRKQPTSQWINDAARIIAAVPVLARSSFPGIAHYAHNQTPGSTDAEYADEDSLNVVTGGDIQVAVEAAVKKHDPVYVRTVASGSDVRGQLRGPGGGSNFARLAGARFDKAGTAISVVHLKDF